MTLSQFCLLLEPNDNNGPTTFVDKPFTNNKGRQLGTKVLFVSAAIRFSIECSVDHILC